MQGCDHLFKVLIIGDSGEGKASVISRMTEGSPEDLGLADFKMVRDLEKRIALQVWDTAGQEKFITISPSFLKGVRLCVFVFDVTSRDSYDRSKKRLRQTAALASDGLHCERLLIGSESDALQMRVVSVDEAEALAVETGTSYLDFSVQQCSGAVLRAKLFEVAAKLTIST